MRQYRLIDRIIAYTAIALFLLTHPGIVFSLLGNIEIEDKFKKLFKKINKALKEPNGKK